jgi:hypothetical protein
MPERRTIFQRGPVTIPSLFLTQWSQSNCSLLMVVHWLYIAYFSSSGATIFAVKVTKIYTLHGFVCVLNVLIFTCCSFRWCLMSRPRNEKSTSLQNFLSCLSVSIKWNGTKTWPYFLIHFKYNAIFLRTCLFCWNELLHDSLSTCHSLWLFPSMVRGHSMLNVKGSLIA